MKTLLSASQEMNATLRSQPCGQFPQGSREGWVSSHEMQTLLAEILSPSALFPQMSSFGRIMDSSHARGGDFVLSDHKVGHPWQ